MIAFWLKFGSLHVDKKTFVNNSVPGRGVGWGTLTFAYYRGSDYLFWFKILNFAIFWGMLSKL